MAAAAPVTFAVLRMLKLDDKQREQVTIDGEDCLLNLGVVGSSFLLNVT